MQISKPQIFNNWSVVANGWYIACASQSLAIGQAMSAVLCGQRIVVFRGQDGQVRALNAYCPHLGTDLGNWASGRQLDSLRLSSLGV